MTMIVLTDTCLVHHCLSIICAVIWFGDHTCEQKDGCFQMLYHQQNVTSYTFKYLGVLL